MGIFSSIPPDMFMEEMPATAIKLIGNVVTKIKRKGVWPEQLLMEIMSQIGKVYIFMQPIFFKVM